MSKFATKAAANMFCQARYEAAKESLLDITADGIISEEEKPELKKIIQTLDEVNEITQNLKNWIERNLE